MLFRSKEVIVGSAEVRQVFNLSKGMPVGGSMVTLGRIVRGKVRVRRRKDVIYEGVTQSLRRFQDEVNEVRAGMECGIRIEGFAEIEVGIDAGEALGDADPERRRLRLHVTDTQDACGREPGDDGDCAGQPDGT